MGDHAAESATPQKGLLPGGRTWETGLPDLMLGVGESGESGRRASSGALPPGHSVDILPAPPPGKG